jgi:hypothetical protein
MNFLSWIETFPFRERNSQANQIYSCYSGHLFRAESREPDSTAKARKLNTSDDCDCTRSFCSWYWITFIMNRLNIKIECHTYIRCEYITLLDEENNLWMKQHHQVINWMPMTRCGTRISHRPNIISTLTIWLLWTASFQIAVWSVSLGSAQGLYSISSLPHFKGDHKGDLR